MVARKSPAAAAMSPLTNCPDDSEATTVNPNTATAKYSAAPKDMAALASSGATETRASALTVPPMKDAHVAMSSARRDSPRAVREGPSSMVAAADTVPRRADEDGGDAAAVNGAHIHAEQRGERLHRGHAEGERDEQGHSHGSGEAGQRPEDNAEDDPHQIRQQGTH